MLKLGYPNYSLTALHEPIFNPVKSGFFTNRGTFAMSIKQTFVSFWKKATEDFIWFYLCDLSDNSINNNIEVVSVAVLLGFQQLREFSGRFILNYPSVDASCHLLLALQHCCLFLILALVL